MQPVILSDVGDKLSELTEHPWPPRVATKRGIPRGLIHGWVPIVESTRTGVKTDVAVPYWS